MLQRREARTDRPHPGGRPRSAWLLPILTVALVFALAVTKVTSFDTWVHLSLGRWMVENGQIPQTNLLSHTMPERPTLDHQWLFQLGLYGAWQVGGAAGAILAKAALVAGAFAFVLATARRKGAGVLAACAVALVAALAARFRFTLRPQVAAFLLFAAYLCALQRWRHGGRRALLLLLPLQVLWANLHGSAVLGIGLLAAYAAGETLRGMLLRRHDPARPSARDLAWLWSIAVALVPLTLLNPNGVGLLTLPFSHAAAQSASGLKELLLDRAGVQWADLAGRHLFFAVLVGMGLPTLLGSLVRRNVTEIGLFVGLLVLATHSERFIGLFAIAAAPIVARNLTALFRWAAAPHRRGIVAAGAAAAMIALTACIIHWQRDTMPFGLGPDLRRLPDEELQFIQANYPDGNLFNEFEHGGYIAWRARRPVFLDSRGLLAYDPALLRAYVASWNPHVPLAASRQALARVLDDCRITLALVGRPRLRELFAADRRWRCVFQGEVAAVYARAER